MTDAVTKAHAQAAETADRLFQTLIGTAGGDAAAGSSSNGATSALERDDAGPSALPVPAAHSSERLRGRRLQLSNPDRPMPHPAAGSAQAKARAKRTQRVTKKWRRALKAEASRDKTFKSGPHDAVQKQSRKPKARKLSLEECKSAVSDDLLEVTHKLWVPYVQDLLQLRKPSALASLQEQAERRGQVVGDAAQALTGALSMSAPTALSKADLTGAVLTVVHCSNESSIGIAGIVVQETEQTFVLATPEWLDHKAHGDGANASGSQSKKAKPRYPITRRFPKHNTTFRASIPVPPATHHREARALLELDLYGNQMKYTLPARATRKAKQRKTIDY